MDQLAFSVRTGKRRARLFGPFSSAASEVLGGMPTADDSLDDVRSLHAHIGSFGGPPYPEPIFWLLPENPLVAKKAARQRLIVLPPEFHMKRVVVIYPSGILRNDLPNGSNICSF